MPDKVLTYAGEDIVVQYNISRCIHAGECVHGLRKVFNPDAKPWINPDEASADAVAEVIHHCPSGALTYQRKDGGKEETPQSENVATITTNGPIYVRGDLRILSADDEEMARLTRAALCRCGASSNKPFCDNSHIEDGFTEPGELSEGGRPPGEDDDTTGVLTIKAARNGSLIFTGPFRIVSASGDERRIIKTSLCRCGHSSKKPFCDRTHKTIGFEA